jgi:hypothetical protein
MGSLLSKSRIRVLVNGSFRGGSMSFHAGPFEDGAEVMSIHVEETDAQVDVESEGAFDAAFAEGGPARGRSVINTFLEIGDYIATEVESRFKPFFA